MCADLDSKNWMKTERFEKDAVIETSEETGISSVSCGEGWFKGWIFVVGDCSRRTFPLLFVYFWIKDFKPYSTAPRLVLYCAAAG